MFVLPCQRKIASATGRDGEKAVPGDIAARHDRTWMKRRRTLSSLIVMLFVFRLVLSGGWKGYATVTAEL